MDILDPEMNMVEYEDEMDGVEYKNDDDEMSKDEHEIPVEQKRSASLRYAHHNISNNNSLVVPSLQILPRFCIFSIWGV